MEPSKGARAGFLQAVRDSRLYLLCLMQNMHLSACSFNNFFPTVSVRHCEDWRSWTDCCCCTGCWQPWIQRYDNFGLNLPSLSGLWIFWNLGRLDVRRRNERTWHITVCMGAALCGFIISCATMNTAARYVSCFLFASGAYAVNSVILGWVAATLGQTTEKKAISLSIVNVTTNVSYVYTAFLYPESDGPRYLTAMVSNAAFAFMTIACAWALRVWLMRTNKKLLQANPSTRVLFAY